MVCISFNNGPRCIFNVLFMIYISPKLLEAYAYIHVHVWLCEAKCEENVNQTCTIIKIMFLYLPSSVTNKHASVLMCKFHIYYIYIKYVQHLRPVPLIVNILNTVYMYM